LRLFQHHTKRAYAGGEVRIHTVLTAAPDTVQFPYLETFGVRKWRKTKEEGRAQEYSLASAGEYPPLSVRIP